MKEFELNGTGYIELDKLMKLLRLVSSGGEAHQWIDQGCVYVNHDVEKRRRRKLRAGDNVTFQETEILIR